MATPEENTLLALRLFQPVSNSIVQGNDSRVALLSRLQEMQNQQAFQRQQAEAQRGFESQYQQQAQAGSTALENLRAGHETDREQLRLQNERILAQETEQRVMNTGKQQQDATEQRDVQKQFSLLYPSYVNAAQILGEDVKPLSEYSKNLDGVGQLIADRGALATQLQEKSQKSSANALGQMMDSVNNQVKGALDSLKEIGSIHQDDRDFGRDIGLKALTDAVQNGAIPGIDIKSDNYKTAISALDKTVPDIQTAKQALGANGTAAIQIFHSAAQNGINQKLNSPERRAQITAASNKYQSVIRNATGVEEKIIGAMAAKDANPYIGDSVSGKFNTLSSLQNSDDSPAPAAPPNTDSVWGQLTQPPPQTGGGAGGSWDTPAAPPMTAQSAAPMSMPGGSPIFNPSPAPASGPSIIDRLRSLMTLRQGSATPISGQLTASPFVRGNPAPSGGLADQIFGAPPAGQIRDLNIPFRFYAPPAPQPAAVAPNENDLLAQILAGGALQAGQAAVPAAPFNLGTVSPNFLSNAAQ